MLKRFRAPLSLVTLFLLLFTFIVPATAAVDPQLTETQAVSMLRTYNIVRGDPSGNLGLNERLTRAQAAAVFVRSLGVADLAGDMAQAVPFWDAQGHWGAGEIAMAANRGLMKGDGDGTFRPNADITYAEVLTVLLRMVQQEPAGAWNPGLIVATASRLGIVPAGIDPSAPAIRGKIFWSLAAAISGIPLATGKTVLQTYVDTRPPVLTVQQSNIATTDATVVINGTAQDAVRVMIDGKPASLSATGAFTGTASVSAGSNVLTVEAFDLANNRAVATVTVERRGAISRIEITGPAGIRVNSSAKLEITAFDALNNPVSLDGIQYDLSGNVATFDPASATIRTGTTKGQATVTARAGNVRKSFTFNVVDISVNAASLRISDVNGGHAPVPGKEVTVKVQVLDDNDRLVTDDFGRTVTLTETGLTGVTVTPRTTTTEAGVATFTVKAAYQGTGTLSAASAGLAGDEVPLEVMNAPRVVLTVSPTTLKADGTSSATIRAQLEDENGQVIRNSTSTDVVVDLQNTVTDGTLSTNVLTIRSNSATSSTTTFRAGLREGTEVISGTIVSGHSYPVQSAVLPITGGSGVKLVVQGPTTNQTPNGTGATITVRVLDSRDALVTTGSYAFQLAVTTNNGELVTNGLPEGVDLVVNGSGYRPVYQGNSTAGDNYVVARTYQGTATLKLTYNKSGTVKLTPRLVDVSTSAYNGTAGFGPAASSLGMAPSGTEIDFAGTPAGIRLTADSVLGTDIPGAAAGISPRQVTIRAHVIDRFGANVPGNRSDVTLTRNTGGGGVSRLLGTSNNSLKKTAVDGVAEFTVQTASTPGYDVYTASANGLSAGTITVAVRDTVADQPLISVIRGVKNGSPSPVNRFVAPDDDYMQIQLDSQSPPNPGEPSLWAVAKVWRKGQSTPIATGVPVDLNQMAPSILIPKSKVPSGTYVYEVAINTGYGDSARSPDQGGSSATSAVYNTSYKITAAQYDAGTSKLVLTTTTLPANPVVDTTQLSIVKGSHRLSLGTATVAAVSSSSITLNLGDAANQLTADVYNGDVLVQGLDGWVTTSDGAQIAKADIDTLIKPMPYITSAALDIGRSTLYLYGAGLGHAPISVDLIEVQDGATTVALTPGTSGDRIASATDGQVNITLTRATLDKIKALGTGVYVTTQLGWMKAGTTTSPFRAAAIADHQPVYFKQDLSSAGYDKTTNILTLNGSGFTGASLDPTKLMFKYSRMAGADWRPASTAAVTIVSDSVIQVHLADADATAFETKFTTKNVYLNTEAGWLMDGQGHVIAPLPANTVTFYVR